jgi:hypothetical protein
VFAAHGHLGSAASFTAGYRPAMIVSASLSLAGALVATAVTSGAVRRGSSQTTGAATAG